MTDQQRRYGVYTGEVVDVDDPAAEGRVKVKFPWMGDDAESYWAPVAVLMAGVDIGTWFRPQVGDEVLVAFEQGDVTHPVILGYLWNGQQLPPTRDNELRIIRSKNGHEISIYDPTPAAGDTGYVRIEDAHGNFIELRNAMVRVKSVGLLWLEGANVMINGRAVAPAGPVI